MLPLLLNSVFSPRFLYVQRCRLHALRAWKFTRDVSLARPLSFFLSGVLLAAVLLTSVTFLTKTRDRTVDQTMEARRLEKKDRPAIVLAQAQILSSMTDGRAFPDDFDFRPARFADDVVATRVDPGCAAHAREKLIVGLTNYYLQRSLNPGSDIATDASSVTGLLTGPGDPVPSTSEASCKT